MDNTTARFVNGLESELARAECKIKFFIKGRGIERIQSTHFLEQGCSRHETRSGNAIGFAAVGVGAVGGVGVAADRIAPAIGKDAPTGVLDRAIDVQQHRSRKRGVRRFLQNFDEPGQPARRHDRIAVEEAQEFTASRFRASVAGQKKAQVLVVADLDQAAACGKGPVDGLGRAIIDDDDFKRRLGGAMDGKRA